jgi:hypothetical protein
VESSTKGNLEGKAEFLTRFVGTAELGGKIDSARKELYQNSDKFFAAQNDAYLAYMFCIIITKDNNLSAPEKLKALQEFKRPVNTPQQAPPLQTREGQLIISSGPRGQLQSDTYADLKIIAEPVLPSTVAVDAIGFDGLKVVGADYKADGLLRLYLEKDKFYINPRTLRLDVIPEGFQQQRIEATVGAQKELRLVRNSPFAIDRITRLVSSDGLASDIFGVKLDDIFGVKLDIVISNRTLKNIYISKFIILLIGANNNGCNPNPIATFKYDATLRISNMEINGSVTAPGDTDGLPVSGDYVHSYCDGYLLASYNQTVPVTPNSKISYVLSLRELDAKATDVDAPKHGGREYYMCELLYNDSRRGKLLKDAKIKQKKKDFRREYKTVMLKSRPKRRSLFLDTRRANFLILRIKAS